ncbi:DoxX family membrane protein [Bradyrhizobium pachyrhizi]|uniref:DoxX family membrane protein n=1 Tax=Bradyrhizobium pachyrhizi TaxID=280333 RepID=A0A844SYX3_9BRAD|nr:MULTISPECIES: DoxX family protein [Bradyrhizobium]MVT68522.1 DoxX family membrane protein [Bradyrhizobium pachyrhizi]WFU57409.1 DoxX family protein [Bradyrhizobium pachyrhizi]WOH82988.1 DoxX family protein [Bradyrhizobium sp. BEA-2-5]
MISTLAARYSPSLLSILRIYVGLSLLQHGTAKILHFPTVPMFANVEIGSLMGVGGLIELVGGALFILGLFTRPVAFILSGFTAVAYFMAHAGKSFYPILNGGELAAVYCFVFLYFMFAGPGPLSLDTIREGKTA